MNYKKKRIEREGGIRIRNGEGNVRKIKERERGTLTGTKSELEAKGKRDVHEAIVCLVNNLEQIALTHPLGDLRGTVSIKEREERERCSRRGKDNQKRRGHQRRRGGGRGGGRRRTR
jgi:hypothetical protein